MTEEQKRQQRERHARYMRTYRKEHPEYAKQQLIRVAIRTLTAEGYTVTAPSEIGR